MSKKNLGQFYTTNSDYIIGDLIENIPANSIIIDPFAGNFDLLNLFSDDKYTKIAYDIDPKIKNTIQQDTINIPPDYKNSWIITNPPYLARNKNTDKSTYEKYNVNDLYKGFLKTITNCNGGIIILPLNFLCDEDNAIRLDFFSKFKIIKLKIFEETVFKDTSYTVCAFFFIKNESKEGKYSINSMLYPSKNNMVLDIEKKFGYKIGGEFYNKIKNNSKLKIERLIKDSTQKINSKINLRAIDTGGKDGRISLFIGEPYYGLTTDRSFATLVFSEDFDLNKQKYVVSEFNKILEENRLKYNSLFLTNFRNSTKNYARKRISFDVAYELVKYIIENEQKLKTV
jgi:hypothetical protein